MIRVLIVDDQALMREGFRLLVDLEADLEVAGDVGNGIDALEAVRVLRPDVVLMDIRMPVLDGLETTRRLMRQPDPPRVLILTTFDLDEYVYEALRAGAGGFLLKDARPQELLDAIRTVAAGDMLLAPTVTRRLIEQFCHRPAPVSGVPAALESLTPRELEVLTLVAQGRSNADIAATLVVGETTIKTHVSRILMKLGLSDRVQAVVKAYEVGLVTPGPTLG